MTTKEFSPNTLAKLGKYVYALVDPDEGLPELERIFYIGKGTGQRCFQHAKGEISIRAERTESRPNPKLDRIRSIHESHGRGPEIRIIKHGMTSDQEALDLEAVLISLLQTDGNLVQGHHSQTLNLSYADIEQLYKNPLNVRELGEDVLLVSLNGGDELDPFPKIGPDALAGRVLGKWVIKEEDSRRVRYVLGIYQQLIQCVFKVELDASGRYAMYTREPHPVKSSTYLTTFAGSLDAAKGEEWIGRMIHDVDGETILTKFRWGVGRKFIAAIK